MGEDDAAVARVARGFMDKTQGADEADPWVVALALSLVEQGKRVTVITEDRRDRLNKTSIQSVCGLLGIPGISIVAFLQHNGYLP